MDYPLTDYLLMKEEVEKDPNPMKKGLWKIANKAVFGIEEPTDEQLKVVSPLYHVSDKTPPVFIWHTANDTLVYVQNSLKFALELSKYKIPYALHIFEDGEHGLSLCDETTAGSDSQINEECMAWVGMVINWLRKR